MRTYKNEIRFKFSVLMDKTYAQKNPKDTVRKLTEAFDQTITDFVGINQDSPERKTAHVKARMGSNGVMTVDSSHYSVIGKSKETL